MQKTPTTSGSGSAKLHSSRYVSYVVALLTVVYVVNHIDRMALAVLAPHIQEDLGLSDAQMGVLIGFAFALFFAVCGIPIARWADQGSRRDIIAIALAIWSAMTALSGAAQNFWQMFMARVGVGVGEAGCVPPSQSMICDYVPVKRRSGVFSIYLFGPYAGITIGMIAAGLLGETVGWRWTFVILGLPGIALAMIVRTTLRDPVRGFFDSVGEDKSRLPFGQTIVVLWGNRTYRLLVLVTVASGFVQFGLSQWWPSFYARVYGLSLSSVGIYLGIAIGAGSGMGLIIGGFVANRVAQHDVGRPLVIGAAGAAMALPLGLGSLFASSALSSTTLVCLTALCWNLSSGAVSASLYSVVTPHMRATAGALAAFLISLLGIGLGPSVVGVLSDLLAPSLGTQSLRYALLIPLCLLPVVAMALFAAAKALPNYLKSMEVQVDTDPTSQKPVSALVTKC